MNLNFKKNEHIPHTWKLVVYADIFYYYYSFMLNQLSFVITFQHVLSSIYVNKENNSVWG